MHLAQQSMSSNDYGPCVEASVNPSKEHIAHSSFSCGMRRLTVSLVRCELCATTLQTLGMDAIGWSISICTQRST